jgi:hypothetical protein
VAIALALIALALLAPAAQARPLDRPDDPVVLTGAATRSLTGAAPGAVVAFAWTDKWRQVPVQVDERKLFDLRLAYPDPFSCAGNGLCYLPFATVGKLRYADPGTLVGADPDASLDADDEIVFMAADAGGSAATAADPSTVVAGSRVRVKVNDPLDGGVGYGLHRRHAGRGARLHQPAQPAVRARAADAAARGGGRGEGPEEGSQALTRPPSTCRKTSRSSS